MNSARELRRKIVGGEVLLADFYRELLSRCRRVNAELNCLITVTDDLTLRSVERLQRKIESNESKGSLFGLPLVVKDNICLEGYPTTCASKILANFNPPYNATVIDKLMAEDAVIIAKSNLDEFAMGSSNENSAFGAVKNPADLRRVPGGSSGGSAAAVAAGLSPIALGSDTGGSVRQPAAFCGVVGLKPTYGAVSRYGLVAYASSLDQIGAFGCDVESAALLFDVISGYDPRDSTSSHRGWTAVATSLKGDLKGLRVGLPKEYFGAGQATSIRQEIERTVAELQKLGVEVKDVSLPHTEYAIACYYIIADAEASSNLARYDGIRYGLREPAENLTAMYTNTRHTGFGAEAKRRIMLGTYVLSSGYYDAYYAKAMKVRELIRRDFETAFAAVDALLTPTTPTTAFRLGEKLSDPLEMYLSDIYTVSVNLAGLPAVSVPCGNDEHNLPIGLQLIGRAFDEATIMRLAWHVEQMHR